MPLQASPTASAKLAFEIAQIFSEGNSNEEVAEIHLVAVNTTPTPEATALSVLFMPSYLPGFLSTRTLLEQKEDDSELIIHEGRLENSGSQNTTF